MSGPRVGAPSTAAMSKEAFISWVSSVGPYWETAVRIYGKPRVRVPVERQTPNEADL